MRNRLRLGQFVTQRWRDCNKNCGVFIVFLFISRQGHQFAEVWKDGYAFTELARRVESISQQREEVERQRKQLAKKKPSSGVTAEKKQSKQKQAQNEGDTFAKPTAPIT